MGRWGGRDSPHAGARDDPSHNAHEVTWWNYHKAKQDAFGEKKRAQALKKKKALEAWRLRGKTLNASKSELEQLFGIEIE